MEALPRHNSLTRRHVVDMARHKDRHWSAGDQRLSQDFWKRYDDNCNGEGVEATQLIGDSVKAKMLERELADLRFLVQKDERFARLLDRSCQALHEVVETGNSAPVLALLASLVWRSLCIAWELESNNPTSKARLKAKLLHLEDELSKVSNDLNKSRTQYLKELTALRERIRRLDSSTEAEVARLLHEEEPVMYYEPIQFLTEDLRDHVVQIVEEKVKLAVARLQRFGTFGSGFLSLNDEALRPRIKTAAERAEDAFTEAYSEAKQIVAEAQDQAAQILAAAQAKASRFSLQVRSTPSDVDGLQRQVSGGEADLSVILNEIKQQWQELSSFAADEYSLSIPPEPIEGQLINDYVRGLLQAGTQVRQHLHEELQRSRAEFSKLQASQEVEVQMQLEQLKREVQDAKAKSELQKKQVEQAEAKCQVAQKELESIKVSRAESKKKPSKTSKRDDTSADSTQLQIEAAVSKALKEAEAKSREAELSLRLELDEKILRLQEEVRLESSSNVKLQVQIEQLQTEVSRANVDAEKVKASSASKEIQIKEQVQILSAENHRLKDEVAALRQALTNLQVRPSNEESVNYISVLDKSLDMALATRVQSESGPWIRATSKVHERLFLESYDRAERKRLLAESVQMAREEKVLDIFLSAFPNWNGLEALARGDVDNSHACQAGAVSPKGTLSARDAARELDDKVNSSLLRPLSGMQRSLLKTYAADVNARQTATQQDIDTSTFAEAATSGYPFPPRPPRARPESAKSLASMSTQSMRSSSRRQSRPSSASMQGGQSLDKKLMQEGYRILAMPPGTVARSASVPSLRM